jgi:site-specific recombinase XerD
MLIQRGNESATPMSTAQRVDSIRALGILSKFPGVTLERVTREWAKRNDKGRDKVEVVLADWITARTAQVGNSGQAISTGMLRNERWGAKRIRVGIGHLTMNQVERPDVEAFLNKCALGQYARQNLRGTGNRFWRWAVRNNHVAENPWTEVASKVKVLSVSILTPEECARLLQAAQDEPAMRRHVLLSLFCGLRPYESFAVTASRLENGHIHVATGKTGERFVPMSTGLAESLKGRGEWPGEMPLDTAKMKMTLLNRKAGWTGREGKNPWPHDVLRHTFASYWLPIHNNRNELAEIMGNSLAVIKKHYRRPISPHVAQRFWALLDDEAKRKPSRKPRKA